MLSLDAFSRAQTCQGSLSTTPDPIAAIGGKVLLQMGREKEEEGKGRGGREKGERGG